MALTKLHAELERALKRSGGSTGSSPDLVGSEHFRPDLSIALPWAPSPRDSEDFTATTATPPYSPLDSARISEENDLRRPITPRLRAAMAACHMETCRLGAGQGLPAGLSTSSTRDLASGASLPPASSASLPAMDGNGGEAVSRSSSSAAGCPPWAPVATGRHVVFGGALRNSLRPWHGELAPARDAGAQLGPERSLGEGASEPAMRSLLGGLDLSVFAELSCLERCGKESKTAMGQGGPGCHAKPKRPV